MAQIIAAMLMINNIEMGAGFRLFGASSARSYKDETHDVFTIKSGLLIHVNNVQQTVKITPHLLYIGKMPCANRRIMVD